MAYDSESDRIILFGGIEADGAPLHDTWAYNFNSNTWTNMTQSGGPPGLSGSSMAYDSQSDQIVLFGGRTVDGCVDQVQCLGDAWTYDFNTNTWTNMAPGISPGARRGTAMVYDSAYDRTVLFGGYDGLGALSDTWAYDSEANIWVELTPRPSRTSNLMAYDSESDRVILVTRNGDVWTYAYGSDMWTKRNPVSGPRLDPHAGSFSDIAYDSESDRIILVDLGIGTWAYDFNTNTWTNMTQPGGPPARPDYSVSYDSQSDRLVLFGSGTLYTCGGRSPCPAETWAYDFNTNTWTNMTQPGGPPSLFGPSMAYDSQSDRVVLFGGGSDFDPMYPPTQCSGYTWVYDLDGNSWTNMSPSLAPAGRAFSGMTYDSDDDRVILYGGGCVDSTAPHERRLYNDTWAYDLDTNAWTNLTPLLDPGPRWEHAVAYDSQYHVVVLFGGTSFFDNPPSGLGPWWYQYPASTPASPRTLRAAEGNRQVTLTWEAPDFDGRSPVTGYRIYRFTWPSGLSIVATVGLVLTYKDTGLANGVLYYYWVSALNAIGEGLLSEAAAATPRLTLSAPMNFQATAGNARVLLTWQAAPAGDDSPISGYLIYRGLSLNSMSSLAAVGNVLAFLDTNVTNGVTYFYRVSALSGADEGPRSNEAMAKPTESTRPAVAILSPADGSTLTSAAVIVSGTASDDTAILRMELSRDGTYWITATGTTSWSGSLNLGEGTNTIYARATDTSGNTETVSITVAVLNPVVAALSSPIVIAAVLAGVSLVLGAFMLRKRRDRRSERG